MYYPAIQARRMQNRISGLGGAIPPSVQGVLTPGTRLVAGCPKSPTTRPSARTMVVRSNTVGGCPQGWQAVTDTNGVAKGCALMSVPMTGIACDDQSPAVFDAKGNPLGCLVQTYNQDPPMLASVDENGNVVGTNGETVMFEGANPFTSNPLLGAAAFALAAVGLGVLAMYASGYRLHKHGASAY